MSGGVVTGEKAGWVRRAGRRAVAGAMRLFRLPESRERVARGFALGLIVNFLPSFGFGVLISGVLARSLGGNLVAGLVGGASLTFVWPLLFYANMRVGSLFIRPPQVIDEVGDVTTESVSALMWGKTFMLGTVINMVVVGLAVYAVMLLVYLPVRPRAVQWLKGMAAKMRRRRGVGAAVS
jgi:uncharacterized protein (DUF2062 family)